MKNVSPLEGSAQTCHPFSANKAVSYLSLKGGGKHFGTFRGGSWENLDCSTEGPKRFLPFT